MSILQHETNENQNENKNNIKRRSSFSKKMTTKNSKAKTTSTDKTDADRTKKVVQFSSKVFVRKFRDTVKPSEAKDVWYNDIDYESFRNDTKKCIRLVQANSPLLDDVTYCRRGADCRTGERFKARSSARSKACDAVLDEQERQWTGSCSSSSSSSELAFVYDDEAIAQLYYRCTLSTRRHAQLVGLSDERAASQEHLPKSETGTDYDNRLSLPRVDSNARLQVVSAQA
eukprot:CAMPEP_0113460026 /NCGR_PEP_ID=MMETSP0014_2-20120614/10769_1 /TAXON_ID=2857 /ORGANISM="Nitzschia sp." /LENGTH=228 /DNA_ID=CAMNT_0000351655 /DNA_START=120 /DNA_END=806 /DNA_ORIENTATION=- /assembly_acc=CAM_ASM_000159